MAVDSAGNVYVTDAGNKAVKMIPAGNGAVVTIATGFTNLFGLALDGKGYLYVADAGTSKIEKIPVGGGTAQVIGTGFFNPEGIALDAAGNVYVADEGHGAVKKILASDGSTIQLASIGNNTVDVAVDAEGNVYCANDKNNVIVIPVSGGSSTTVGFGFTGVQSVTVDQFDNLYVGDNNHALKIFEAGRYILNTPLPAGLTFNTSTGVISGTPTTLSPATNYSVTAKTPAEAVHP